MTLSLLFPVWYGFKSSFKFSNNQKLFIDTVIFLRFRRVGEGEIIMPIVTDGLLLLLVVCHTLNAKDAVSKSSTRLRGAINVDPLLSNGPGL